MIRDFWKWSTSFYERKITWKVNNDKYLLISIKLVGEENFVKNRKFYYKTIAEFYGFYVFSSTCRNYSE